MREPWAEGAPARRIILPHGHVPDGFALLHLAHHAVQDGANVLALLEAPFGPPLRPGR